MKKYFSSITLITLSSLCSAQTISCECSAYGVASDGSLSAEIVITPAPAAGLFSGSVLVNVTGPNMVGFSRIALVPELDFAGPDGDGALLNPGLDQGSAAGTVDFFDPSKGFYQGQALGTFEVGGFTMDGDYTLSLAPNPILGTPGEVLFVDGNCQPLDGTLAFGTANLTVGIIATASATGVPVLDNQSGLFLQTVRLTNVTAAERGDFRIFIDGLPAGMSLANAHGEVDGTPYVDYRPLLAGGAFVDLVLEFYSATRMAPGEVTLSVLDADAARLDPDGSRAVGLSPRIEFQSPSGSLLLEFATEADTTYLMQYSTDMVEWKTVVSPIAGTGSRVQWIDNGPPKTDCHPALCPNRFYRIIEQQP